FERNAGACRNPSHGQVHVAPRYAVSRLGQPTIQIYAERMELSFRPDGPTGRLSFAESLRWGREARHACTGVAAFHAYRLSLAGEWTRTAEGNHAFTLDRANQLGQRLFRSG